MSYRITFSDKTKYLEIPDGSVESETTSLQFPGNFFPGYSKLIGENFLHLLENFANLTPPVNPTRGQLWYNSTAKSPQLRLFDGVRWVAAGAVERADTPPEAAISGDLWSDLVNNQLKMWTGEEWVLVGPQFSEGGQTGIVVEEVLDIDDEPHYIVSLYVQSQRIVIISKDSFDPKLSLSGFGSIRTGISISGKDFDNTGVVSNKLWGTSLSAEGLVIGDEVIPASKVVRSDMDVILDKTLLIKDDAGIKVGVGSQSRFYTNGMDSVIETSGQRILLNCPAENGFQTVASLSSTNSRFNGDMQISGSLQVNGSINFGSTNGTLVFETSTSPAIISTKTAITELSNDDEFLVNSNGNGLRKVTKRALVSNVLPVGAVMLFSGESSLLPNGHLLCNGQELWIEDYQELYNVIGDKFGPSAVNKFKLPNLSTSFPLNNIFYMIYTGKFEND